jgi:hypothetical protein
VLEQLNRKREVGLRAAKEVGARHAIVLEGKHVAGTAAVAPKPHVIHRAEKALVGRIAPCHLKLRATSEEGRVGVRIAAIIDPDQLVRQPGALLFQEGCALLLKVRDCRGVRVLQVSCAIYIVA